MQKRLWLLFIIMAFITLFSISKVFAVFETNASSTSDMNIGSWVIKINNEDISLSESISLSNFTYTSGVHTQSGYFAPGSVASFDVVIDTSLCDVSVIYDFTIDDSELDDHPNIALTVTNLNTNQVISTDTFSDVISLNAQNRTLTLRFNLTWTNNSTYDPNDSELIDGDLSIDVTANFKQYLGV